MAARAPQLGVALKTKGITSMPRLSTSDMSDLESIIDSRCWLTSPAKETTSWAPLPMAARQRADKMAGLLL